jgi:hypothetical protein
MKVDISDLAFEITNDILSETDLDWDGYSDMIESLIEERLQMWVDDGKLSLGS